MTATNSGIAKTTPREKNKQTLIKIINLATLSPSQNRLDRMNCLVVFLIINNINICVWKI